MLLLGLKRKKPGYKDILSGTIGISFEAIGVELVKGETALILPLLSALLFALILRFLPDKGYRLRVIIGKTQINHLVIYPFLVTMFFFVQATILLLAYTGRLALVTRFPGVP